MGGWYRLGPYDARQLGTMVGETCTGRSRVQRATMALWCWSQMQASGRPCPHFTAGIRRIADGCEVSVKAARTFLERLEDEGWVVRVGTVRNKGGEFTKRTFLWVAEEAAEKAGTSLDEWLGSLGGVPQKGHTGGYFSQGKGAHRCALNPPKRAHIREQSSQRGALRLSAGAEAQAPFEDAAPPVDPMVAAGVDLAPGWLSGAGAEDAGR